MGSETIPDRPTDEHRQVHMEVSLPITLFGIFFLNCCWSLVLTVFLIKYEKKISFCHISLDPSNFDCKEIDKYLISNNQ